MKSKHKRSKSLNIGYRCFWFAGELDKDPRVSMLVPEAFFQHPDNVALSRDLFGVQTRARTVTDRIYKGKEYLKEKSKC